MRKTYKVVNGYISRKGYPEHDPNYHEAHTIANQKEKAKYPKGYLRLKKLDQKVPAGKMIGHNTKSGKISVSNKVPKSLREEVAFHERVESKALRRLRNKR
ncbi:MAG TPA: hypothetical protein VGW78_07540 [Candidatus Babeliales bacterium]|jgi:hypothetical protein|nr:hypothetical protein [Candidatus Babeliales bacterium]